MKDKIEYGQPPSVEALQHFKTLEFLKKEIAKVFAVPKWLMGRKIVL